ncbi:HYR domain-containing protein [Mangrovimonas aestuarii]|uniref:HYR domain-containing protein n=1 Tax=Mangrovimonas aestuarii TaxID=3018443 RepID=UPI002379B12F|nr:HYR domain-containing protein [Mangrovimonas aestuarii]
MRNYTFPKSSVLTLMVTLFIGLSIYGNDFSELEDLPDNTSLNYQYATLVYNYKDDVDILKNYLLISPIIGVDCPKDIIQNTDPGKSSAVVTYNTPIPSHRNSIIVLTTGLPSGSNFPIGTTLNTFEERDTRNNVIDSCSFSVTVEDKLTPIVTEESFSEPLISGFQNFPYKRPRKRGLYTLVPFSNFILIEPAISCPSDTTLNTDSGVCSAIVNYITPLPSVFNTIVQTEGMLSGSSFPVGITTNTFEERDSGDNVVSTCSFTVTVNDNESPIAACHNHTVQLDASGNASISAEDIDNGSSDNCGIASMSVSPNSFDCSDVGANTVTLTVTDVNGNTSTCTSTVTVQDNVAPIASCQNHTVQLDASGNASISAADIDNGSSDNCDIASISVSPNSFDCSDVGANTVTLTVTDVNGNSSTCTSTVTVQDNVAPIANCQNHTVQLDASGNASISAEDIDNGSSDNCDIASISVSPNSFDCSDVGANTVTLSVTDVNGNSSTCTSTVTVQDNVAPIANCQNHTVQLDAFGNASISAADIDNNSSDNCGIASISVSPNSFDCSDVGANTVTLTVTDVNGNSSTCTSTITVQDNVAPIANCQNHTVQLDASGNASISAADIDNGSSDNCDITSMSVSPNSFDCSDVGANTVTLTVTDVNGNTSTCTSTVTVQDNVAPIANCQNHTVQLDASGNASISAADIDNGSSDNCGIASISVSPNSFDCSDVGANTVTLTVTDVNGNTSTCTSTVTVQDNVAPIANCQNHTVQLDASGNASISAADIDNGSSDNCGIASISVSPNSFDCSDVGANTVTLTVTDVNGNSSTCTSTVTVQDNVAPIANCQNHTVQLDASGNASISAADIDNGSSDNCGIASISVSPNSFDCSDVGANTVTLTVTDVNGNTSTCTSTVTVQDNVAPIANCQNHTVQLDASGNASISAADIDNGSSDNCGIASISVSPNSFDCSDVGANTVTLTVTDVNGNSSTCTSTVTVQDNVAPIANCQNHTVQLDASGNASISVADIDNGSSDNCGIASISVSPNSFDCSDVGANTVTLTVTDVNGNTSTCTSTVTVQDTTPPTISCLADIIVSANAFCSATGVALGTPTTSDNCGVDTVTNNAPATFPLGNTTVTWTVTDDTGLTNTCTQTVTVEDTTPPTISCPANVTVSANASCTATSVALGTPNTSDNCGVDTVTNNAPATFPLGNTTVTWTVTDNAGLTATCTQTVTVEDTTPPTISCPTDITFGTSNDGMGNCSTTANITPPSTSDNCGVNTVIAKIGGTTVNTSSYVYPLGTTTITWIATDGSGNSSQCTQTITIEDDEDPSVNCPPDQNVNFEADCEYTLLDYTSTASTSDNCDSNVTVTQSPLPGSVLSGAVVVTITATDDVNNSSTCTFNVIPSDNEAPTAVCQNYTAVLSSTGTVNIFAANINNGSSDNCGVANMTVNPSSFNCDDVGLNTVTFTAYDNAGNSDSCTATVTVIDNTPPTMQCNNFVAVIDAITREATIVAADVDNGSYDACGIASLTVSPSVFPEAEDGLLYTTTTTLTAVDANGNVSTCTSTITVEPPKNLLTYMTGVITDPTPDNPQPPGPLVEVTACPGELLDGVTVLFNLQGIAPYNLQASDVIKWEASYDYGETWTDLSSSSNTLTYTLVGLINDTFVRAVITDPDTGLTKTTAEVYVRFLPPDEPPIITNISNTLICLGESVTVIAESFFDQPSGQFGEGGEFNHAQPEGWRVDGIDGFFPASGNTTTQPTWKETNSNNNQEFSGINYDTTDNTKFAMANGEGNDTTLETPVFSTIGMTSSEAIMTFQTSWYFCNGGYGKILLSFDSGNTYPTELNTVENYDFDSSVGGTTTSGVILASGSGNKCMGQTDPRMMSASIDLGAYVGLSGLRIMFQFHGSDTDCGTVTSSTFSNPNGISCSSNGNANILSSGWAVDKVGFAYAQVNDELEWTDEDNNVIAIGTTASVTPVTPGIRTYGVTNLVNGCRTDNDDGTNFIDVETSLAYAGKDYTPLNSECGENTLQLMAYDNTKTAVENYDDGAWENNLYVVPNVAAGDTNYLGTGIGGTWSIMSSTFESCGNTAVFSSNTDPRAIFTADPGTYTLRWTLDNGCYDDVNVVIKDCPTIDFDGVNDYVTFKNNYNINSEFSIEIWVKPNSINGTRTVFSRKDAGNNTTGYDLGIVNGQVRFGWNNSSGSGSVTSGSYSIGTDRWYHLAMTFDGASYTLYVDGIVLGNSNGTAPDMTNDSIEALIGAMDQASPNDPTNFYHGWIDELRIWNKALTAEHIHQMMNQEIQAMGADVGGVVITDKIYGPDYNNDGIEDDVLQWSNLEGYYKMNLYCGDISAYKGVSGRLRNITTSQQQTAPLPYLTSKAGNWGNDTTTASPWLHYSVWNYPNSTGINGDPIDWNIVKTSHNLTTHNSNITVLGLINNSGKITVSNPNDTQNETNSGIGLWVTHYLKLNGIIDLVGESQLVQKRYISSQFNESTLDASSSGYIERDQQGTSNLYNYNYWSSPVSPQNPSNINTNYTVGGVLMDGTNSANPQTINWIGGYNATASPLSIPNYWIWSYNAIANTYLQWNQVGSSGTIPVGNGYTMKGSGASGDYQNYVFKGKPHNGTIQNSSSALANGEEFLIGNPYPCAMDANEFIKDNISGTDANPGSTNAIDGTLYFWVHFTSNNSHILNQYEGGYATYNLSGALPPTVPSITEDGFEISGLGSSDLMPGRYIPVGQGFFVGALEAGTGGQIKFENDQRIFKRENDTENSEFLRTANTEEDSKQDTSQDLIKRIRLSATTPSKMVRHLMLAFVDNKNATDGINFGYDAKNIDTYKSDVLWNISDEDFNIQGVSTFNRSKQYPLHITLGQDGAVEISLTELENFNETINVYVYDSLLDNYTLINDTPYRNSFEAGEYKNRFYIAFENTSSARLAIMEKQIENTIINYLRGSGEVYIKTPSDTKVKQISLINSLGQQIKIWNANNIKMSNELKIPITHISEGSYIIKVQTDVGQTINKKVVITR